MINKIHSHEAVKKPTMISIHRCVTGYDEQRKRAHRAESRRDQMQDSNCPLSVESSGEHLRLLATMCDNMYGILAIREAHPTLGV